MKEAKELLPTTIQVGDRIKLYEKTARAYQQAYGLSQDATWVVTGEDFPMGRRRLHVEGPPTCIWVGDARLVYSPQSKDRRERLALSRAARK